MTKKTIISLIAAINTQTRGIGLKNKLLWKLTGDLPRFKNLTNGHPIIMGRKTYESIGHPLSNRTNIVISKTLKRNDNNIFVCHSLEEALKISANSPGKEEIFVIGGGQIYTQFLPLADRLYLTLVNGNFEADTFFPDYSDFKKETKKENHFEHDPPFSYVILER